MRLCKQSSRWKDVLDVRYKKHEVHNIRYLCLWYSFLFKVIHFKSHILLFLFCFFNAPPTSQHAQMPVNLTHCTGLWWWLQHLDARVKFFALWSSHLSNGNTQKPQGTKAPQFCHKCQLSLTLPVVQYVTMNCYDAKTIILSKNNFF